MKKNRNLKDERVMKINWRKIGARLRKALKIKDFRVFNFDFYGCESLHFFD